ncbi:MAG: hypothetical protein QM768_17055 [Agriterribacter sp.]
MAACGEKFANDEHPAYFDRVINSFDSMATTQPLRSVEILDSSYNAFPRPGIIDQQNVMLAKLIFFYETKRDTPLTYLYLDSAINLIKDKVKANEKRAVAYALMLRSKAYCLKTVRNYNEALHYYLMASQVVAAYVKDPCFAEADKSYIGDIMFAQGKYMLAAENYRADNEKVTRCGEKKFVRFFLIQKNLSNIGLCYFKMGLYDSAYIYYNRSLEFINQNWRVYGLDTNLPFLNIARATATGFMATVLAQKLEYQQAEELFDHSIEGVKMADPGFCEMLMASRAAMYVQLKEPNKALLTLQVLDSMLNKHKNTEVLLESYRIKSDLYDLQKNDYLFLQYTERYSSLKDSLTGAAKLFDRKNLELEFENNEEEGINQRLEERSREKNRLLVGATGSAVLLCCIVVLIWMSLKNTRRYLERLQRLNKIVVTKKQALENALVSVEQNNHENSRMMKIVAHDLRSPVTGISHIVFSILAVCQDADIKKDLEIIQEECKNCDALIQALLLKD